jgi:8-oxo-dGTP pyrophosphatase MutT (NUDIX family)
MLSSLARFVERRPFLHRLALRLWRSFPPRLAGYLKGRTARSWLVGVVAVMLDRSVDPPQVLLVEHSYRRRGAWGLPGGALDSIPGDPVAPGAVPSPDDVLESNLQREVGEELDIALESPLLLRVDAMPYVPEEPGPCRLDFYFLCQPREGFAGLRHRLAEGSFRPASPEITAVQLRALDDLDGLDLFSAHRRLLTRDLPRLLAALPGPVCDG